MKKIILFAILLVGGISFASAQCDSTKVQTTDSTEQVVSTDNYKEVALTDLSAVVQTAVTNLAGDTFDVKKVEFDADKEVTKVTLTKKDDQSEKVVILDKEGKDVTAPDPAPAQE